jgi:hypothetical protein
MKLFKFGLRIWITISSIVVFLVSWVMFSHSPKPIDWSSTVSSVPTLEPLPPIQGLASNGPGTMFSVQQQQSVFQPRRRSMFITGGS